MMSPLKQIPYIKLCVGHRTRVNSTLIVPFRFSSINVSKTEPVQLFKKKILFCENMSLLRHLFLQRLYSHTHGNTRLSSTVEIVPPLVGPHTPSPTKSVTQEILRLTLSTREYPAPNRCLLKLLQKPIRSLLAFLYRPVTK